MASLQPHYPPFPQYLIQERARVKKQLLSATQELEQEFTTGPEALERVGELAGRLAKIEAVCQVLHLGEWHDFY